MRTKPGPVLKILLAVTLLGLLSPPPGLADERGPETGQKSPSALAALQVADLSGALEPEDLAGALAGEGVVISDVVYTGAEQAAGTFSGGQAIVGFDSGILLTTGAAGNVAGPNLYDNIGRDNGLEGDAGLAALAGYPTFDAAVLEFDFLPDAGHISFQFVFASEEYNEWVHSVYNDVFAFTVNGQNCALVEGDPISVNTINNGDPYGSDPRLHPGLFRNNELKSGGGSIDTEMDGLTTVLTCAAVVDAGQLNHMKLAIADASDHLFDSAVFLQAGSVTTARRPVMLIPGMFASFNVDCFFQIPFLCNPEDEWGWFPALGETVYDSLLDFLRKNGYTEENGLLAVFFYDWRRPVGDNVPLLKDAIAGFRARTGAGQVDLIGHSMGGLLARAYVQDDGYASDVAHLVTIGSPHTGAAKVYPYYEAAYFYQANWLEERVMGVLLEYIRVRQLQPIPVLALRQFVPSMQNLLPAWDYLYQSGNDSQMYEKDMVHRNNYLPELNENAGALYARLGQEGLATIAGTNDATTERFYVNPYDWWGSLDGNLWWAWDDGEPDWPRAERGDFYEPAKAGDGTVLVKSALLAAPARQVIVGGETPLDRVDHLSVVADQRTLFAIGDFMDLSPAPATLPPYLPQVLVLYVYGPVDVSVTDPLGRSLDSPGLAPSAGSAGPIPLGEYLVPQSEPFQLILIPEPVAGDYIVEIESQASGDFTIGLLDTFDPQEQTSPDLAQEWDTSVARTEAGTQTQFIIPYTPGSEEVNLLAETPVIEVPLFAGAQLITGRAMAGSAVEIRTSPGDDLLGGGTAGPDGLYAIPLDVRLKIGQRIYPRAGAVDGIAVEVLARYNYLPGVQNSP